MRGIRSSAGSTRSGRSPALSGGRTLQAIGKTIVEHGDLPAEAEGIVAGLRGLDVGYHESHRIAGRVLYDARTGALSEGIGHYQISEAGEHSVRLVVDSPLPCAFDVGVIRAIAHRFKPAGSRWVSVEHGLACRSDGARACLYVVSWVGWLREALLAAQAAYADSGGRPESLAICQLLRDTALRIRQRAAVEEEFVSRVSTRHRHRGRNLPAHHRCKS